MLRDHENCFCLAYLRAPSETFAPFTINGWFLDKSLPDWEEMYCPSKYFSSQNEEFLGKYTRTVCHRWLYLSIVICLLWVSPLKLDKRQKRVTFSKFTTPSLCLSPRYLIFLGRVSLPGFRQPLLPVSVLGFLHEDLLRGFWLDKDVLCLFSLFRQQRGPWCECDSAAWFSPLNGSMKRVGCWLWLAAGCQSQDPLYAWHWMETMSFSTGALDTWQHASCLIGGNLDQVYETWMYWFAAN